MIVLLDQDGPLANFEKGFLEKWKERHPEKRHVPLDRRKTFYVRDQYPENLREEVESIYQEPGFYRNLPLVQGAKEAILEMLNLGLDVRICTSPLSHYENCVLEKYEWVEKHFGREFTKRICMTKDKTMVRGDILIDDRPEITGRLTPEWHHLIFDAPSNNHVCDVEKLDWAENWKSMVTLTP